MHAEIQKDFDIVIQLTQEYILDQRFKKKKWTKKITFHKDSKCYKASKFLYKNDLAKSLFRNETNFERFFLKSLNMGGVFRIQWNISNEIIFQK